MNPLINERAQVYDFYIFREHGLSFRANATEGML